MYRATHTMSEWRVKDSDDRLLYTYRAKASFVTALNSDPGEGRHDLRFIDLSRCKSLDGGVRV